MHNTLNKIISNCREIFKLLKMANSGEKTEALQDTESKPAVEVLEPGKNIRPIMTEDQARELVERLFGLQVSIS